jgi:crotonobetainyl-CoA:carnitine CoA-transferase CaiB-like acyl-CoA transferase
VVTDTQWEVFCREFGAEELKNDARLRSNAQRVKERSWLLPALAELLRKFDQKSLAAKLEQIGLPFAPIAKPWDLLDDPHLRSHGGLVPTRAGAKTINVPALPLELDGRRLPKRLDPPHVGEHGRDLLIGLGYQDSDIQALAAAGIVALPG